MGFWGFGVLGFWDRFSIFPGALEHSFRRNNTFGWVLSGFGWGSWWGPRGQQFRWNSADLGGFWMGFGDDICQIWSWGLGLGAVFDFFQRPRLLLWTKQSVWAGSEWSRVWFVVGSQPTTIRSKFAPNSPHTLRSGSEWALTEINLTSRLIDRTARPG